MAEVLPGRSAAAPALPIVPLREDRLSEALQLSQALRWPYRLEDWRDALRLGHGLAVDVDDRVRATALWWPWGERFATCGMIIVDDALQGRGIGAALMRELLERSQPRSMLLRSTLAGEKLYLRLGFVPIGRVHQHQATLAAPPSEPRSREVRWCVDADVPAIASLDREASGMDRARLLDALHAGGRIAVAGSPGRPTGYACVRRWGRGVVIGPVIARDDVEARTLIVALLHEHVGGFVRIDIAGDDALSPWLESLGLPCVDRVTSMVRGARPARSAQASQYALASQSLG